MIKSWHHRFRITLLSLLMVAMLFPPFAAPAEAGVPEELPEESRFYRGINFGKDSTDVVIDGNGWMSMAEAQADSAIQLGFSNDVVSANLLSNPVIPNPPRDDDYQHMLNTYVYREYQNVGVNQLLASGEYYVYVWFMELSQNNLTGFHIEFEGERKGTIGTANKGVPVRYGPYKVNVADGQLNTLLVYDYNGLGKAGRVRIMGMEIYTGGVDAPEPPEDPSYFYRGINLGKDATAVTVDGNAWMSMADAMSDGTVGLRLGSDVIPANTLSSPVVPDPPRDAEFQHMLNTYVYREYQNVGIHQLLEPGEYAVYVWFMELYQDNATGFHLELEGQRKGTIATAKKGVPVRYGPYRVTVADGELNTVLAYDYDGLGKAGRVRIMGMELYSTEPPPAARVGAVQATPDAGSFSGTTQVSLSTTTVGAFVYYSLNDQPFQMYAEPLRLDRSTKVTTYAAKEGMTDSLTKQLYYKNTRLNIPKSLSPITIDGDRNEEGWTHYVSETLGAAQQLSGTATGSVTNDVYMTWDPDNLYVFADVTDPTPRVNTRTGINIWDGDNLELFLGAKDVYEDGMIKKEDRQLIISAGEGNLYHWYNAPAQAEVEASVVSSENGYRIEAAIPWEALDLQAPEIGTELRMDVGFGDAEVGKRVRQWMWNGTTQNSGNRSGWGMATLVSGTDPGTLDTLRVMADDDSLLLHEMTALHLKAMMTNGQVVDLSSAEVQYDTDRSDIATVNDVGIVTAVGYGTAQVEVTVVANGVTLNGSIPITVQNPEEQFAIGAPIVVDAKGQPLTTLGVEGLVRATIEVTNTWATTADVVVTAAAYGTDGVKLQQASVRQTVDGSETATLVSGFQLPADVAYMEIFVEDAGGAGLLSNVVRFPGQEAL